MYTCCETISYYINPTVVAYTRSQLPNILTLQLATQTDNVPPTHQSLPKSFNKCEFPWFSLYLYIYIYILDRTWQPSTSLALLLEPLLWPMHSTLLFLIVSCLEVSLDDLISNIQNLNAPIVCKWLIYYYYHFKPKK